MVQYGFFYDQSRCIGCQTCSIVCQTWNYLPPGPLKYMRVCEYEKGTWPDSVRLHFLAIPCYHCENPPCVDACPGGAIYKEDKYGAVLVDQERCVPSITKCSRACWEACPWGSLVFPSDDPNARADKCNMCIDRLEQGDIPICITSCSMRALEFGPINELKEKFGRKFTLIQQLDDMPSPKEAKPAVVIKAADPKKKLVRYDVKKAIQLWQLRGPYAAPNLPPLFQSESDITDAGAVRIGRDRLMLKTGTVKELMYYTVNNE